LVGTTALHEDTKTVLETCAKTAPVMIAANTSFGHIVLKQMAKIAAELLDETFDIDIIDTHHRHKKDAPSGTAVNLKAALAPIAKSPIHMHAIRAGEVIGKHTISFHGKYEAIELTHTASSRYLFASGALSLAKWLLNKKPGLYSQDDIIRKNL
jgi:4-hydroxy-tetrahydrodipicolinate reductase